MATTRKKKRSLGSTRVSREERSTFRSKSIRPPEDFELFKIDKAGPKYLAFLPYVVKEESPGARPGDLFPYRRFWVHRGIGPNNETYCCPYRNWNKRCPICEERDRLRRDDADDDTVNALNAKERQLWLVMDMKNPSKGVQLWDVSYYLFGEMLDDFLKDSDEGDHYDNYWHPEGGFVVKVGFKEKRYAGTTYYESSSIEFRPRKHDYDDELLDSLPCLDDLLIETSYSELKSAMSSFDDGDDDEEPTDEELDALTEEPAPWDGDDDEEEPEDDSPDEPEPEPEEDEEPEEEEKPKKKRRGRPPKSEPKKDDDWDDDGDDWKE